MHHLVHNKCGPGHITCIFQYADPQKEEEDVGEKHQYTPYPANDTIDYKSLEVTRRQCRGSPLAKGVYPILYPLHWIPPKGEGHLEEQIHEEEKQWISQEPIGDKLVNGVAYGLLGHSGELHGLLEGTGDEPISRLCNYGLWVVVHDGHDVFLALLHLVQDLLGPWRPFNPLSYLWVAFQELYGSPTGVAVAVDLRV